MAIADPDLVINAPIQPKAKVDLIPPFFRGNGKDLSQFLIFYNDMELTQGMVMSTENYQLFIVLSSTLQEDLFENIGCATCQLITKDCTDVIDQETRQLHYMYSAQNTP